MNRAILVLRRNLGASFRVSIETPEAGSFASGADSGSRVHWKRDREPRQNTVSERGSHHAECKRTSGR